VECSFPLSSPTEREDEDSPYQVINRLLWLDDGKTYWTHALPLFAIESEDDIQSELICPVRTLVAAKAGEDAKKLEAEAFSKSKKILRWQLDPKGRVLLHKT
jgi:hypothetical protein